jgi:hypothetical protein
MEQIEGRVYCDKSKGGYNFLISKGKRRKLSRVLMERELNRTLNPFDVVHHKNGIKNDDRIENLEVKPTEEHTSEHRAGMRRPST